jgi:hypothetical protein
MKLNMIKINNNNNNSIWITLYHQINLILLKGCNKTYQTNPNKYKVNRKV